MAAYRLILAAVGLALIVAALVFALPVGAAVAGFSCCAASFVVRVAEPPKRSKLPDAEPPKRSKLPDADDPWNVDNLPRSLRTLDGPLKPYAGLLRRLDSELAADKITTEEYIAAIAALDAPPPEPPPAPKPRAESSQIREANEWLAHARAAQERGQMDIRNYYLKRAYKMVDGTDHTVLPSGGVLPTAFLGPADPALIITLPDKVSAEKLEQTKREQMELFRTITSPGACPNAIWDCAAHRGEECDCGA